MISHYKPTILDIMGVLCFVPAPSRAQLCVTEMHCVSNKICVDGDGCGSIMIHRVDGMFGASKRR